MKVWGIAVRVWHWLALLLATLAVLVTFLGLSGCYDQQEWLGRHLSGIDCRPEKLDAQGRCVPYR